jgi:hypothetical protein
MVDVLVVGGGPVGMVPRAHRSYRRPRKRRIEGGPIYLHRQELGRAHCHRLLFTKSLETPMTAVAGRR